MLPDLLNSPVNLPLLLFAVEDRSAQVALAPGIYIAAIPSVTVCSLRSCHKK